MRNSEVKNLHKIIEEEIYFLFEDDAQMKPLLDQLFADNEKSIFVKLTNRSAILTLNLNERLLIDPDDIFMDQMEIPKKIVVKLSSILAIRINITCDNLK